MKRIRRTTLLVALVATALGLPLAAASTAEPAAAPPGKIADSWLMWVKPGHEAEFEAAVKAHAAWRKSAGEGWTWRIYQPVVGDDLTFYVIRSGGHAWADLDANRDWERQAKAVEQFDQQVGPLVARYVHHLSESDLDHSHWIDNPAYRYFSVTELQLRPGAYGEMTAALDKVQKAATDAKWPHSYALSWQIGGSGGLTVVYPYTSYADMADPETPFLKVLAGSLGSEDAAKATMKQLNASFESDSKTTIFVARPDLSTP